MDLFLSQKRSSILHSFFFLHRPPGEKWGKLHSHTEIFPCLSSPPTCFGYWRSRVPKENGTKRGKSAVKGIGVPFSPSKGTGSGEGTDESHQERNPYCSVKQFSPLVRNTKVILMATRALLMLEWDERGSGPSQPLVGKKK